MHNIIYWLLMLAAVWVWIFREAIKFARDFGKLLEMAEQERDI